MEEKIRRYMDELFESAPQTQKSYEMKIEMTQSVIDHYYSLLNDEKNREEAYSIAIMNIGDVSELFYSLDDFSGVTYQTEKERKNGAAITAIAVVMYILSIIPLIVLSELGLEIIGLVIMLVIVSLATGILVYHNMTKPKKDYLNRDNVVSDFRDWKVRQTNKKQILKLINSVYWPCVLTLYFVISFATNAWWITWLIFIIAPALLSIIKAALTFHDDSGNQ